MTIPQNSVLNTKGWHRIVTLEFYDISLSLVFFYNPVSGPGRFSIVEIIIKEFIRHVSFLFCAHAWVV